ncbi:MAG: hypothetical protein K9L66_00325 [Spirochaetaceae bacterium]|nr:hypothetical protein [Spirochaetaceae bacterium]MCF7947192.1 hypothetical protein [Spirochaetia bacterium]MCF7950057.1 hypothetical protein [Spirochaetaceae bacterium]
MKKLLGMFLLAVFVFTAAAEAKENYEFEHVKVTTRDNNVLKVSANDQVIMFNYIQFNYFITVSNAEKMIEILEVAMDKLTEEIDYSKDYVTNNNPSLTNIYKGEDYGYDFYLWSKPRRLILYLIGNDNSKKLTFEPESVRQLMNALKNKVELVHMLKQEQEEWMWPEEIDERILEVK